MHAGQLTYSITAIEGVDAKVAADRIMARVVTLGQRFYPSESAFPLREYLGLISSLYISH